MTSIGIGSDHGGYELKGKLIEHLKQEGYDVKDFGTHSKESCDYPLIGFEVAKAVSLSKVDKGVLICKTGVGMAIIANKLPGIRAAACYDLGMAKSSREHNDCNVIVLASDYTDLKASRAILDVWLEDAPLADRHARRVKQIKEIESKLRERQK